MEGMWINASATWSKELQCRVERENNPAFAQAVRTMESQLFCMFGVRSACILSKLPTDFILTNGKASSAAAIRNMKHLHSLWFSDYDSVNSFLDTLKQALPSLVVCGDEDETTSTGMQYDPVTKMISIVTRVPSEFHPTKQLYMRESYWPIIRELRQCSAAVVIGDPGIGKSSLLRVVYEMFVHEWPAELTTAATSRHLQPKTEPSGELKPFSESRGVFWIMESGQFHYALRQDDGCVMQGEGVYGRGDTGNDVWRRRDVVLLVDGAVPTAFLAKISNIYVFASPQPTNYHRMAKATNAVKLTLPPWSEDEVLHLLKHCREGVLERMAPYLKYVYSKISSTYLDKDNFVDGAQRIDIGDDEGKTPKLEEDGNGDVPMVEEKAIGDIEESTASDNVPGISAKMKSLAQSANNVWGYDELSAVWSFLGTSALAPSRDTEEEWWSFLHDHIERRYRLVGGRIRLLLNPSETFVTLKKQVKTAIHAVSVGDLREESSIDSHRYVPSVLYSLIPSQDPRDPPELIFASETISCLVLARLARAKGDDIINFLSSDGGSSIFGSLLGYMFESFVHNNLPKGVEVEIKYLHPPHSSKKSAASPTKITLPALESVVVNLPAKPKKNPKAAVEVGSLKIEPGNYYRPRSANQPQVDSIIVLPNPFIWRTDSPRTPRYLMMQATISSQHSFIPHNIEYLASKLECPAQPLPLPRDKTTSKQDELIDYGFVIITSNAAKFTYHGRQGTHGDILTSNKGIAIPQFALSFTSGMFQHLSECVERLAEELGGTDVVSDGIRNDKRKAAKVEESASE